MLLKIWSVFMLRIFVTGDNHIGLKYARHEKAAVLVSARISAFDNVAIKILRIIANKQEIVMFII